MAAQAYQAGDYPTAIIHFRNTIKFDAHNEMAWLFLGQSQGKSGDVMGARISFAKLLSMSISTQVAERAREQLAKLPEPDLFAMQLDSGITLGDWMKLANKRIAEGKRDAVAGEIEPYLTQFGPVPQLLALREKLQKQMQAEQEQRLKSAIAALKVTDAESAKTALPQIRQLKSQMPGNLALLKLEGRACHLMQDFACAEAAYAAWLKVAPGNETKRGEMVELLMQAKQHETLPPAKPIEMVAIPGKHYELGKYEVTKAEWQSVMDNNPSHFTSCGDSCPVEQVSWDDIQAFLQKLNAETGRQYRLPTEAEWEYACYGGSKTEYCGSDSIDSVAWYGNNGQAGGNSSQATHPTGQKQANGFGLYDMSGNVWQWMENKYDNEHDSRALRGGSWYDGPQCVRAAFRNNFEPAFRSYGSGFCVARTLP